MNVANQFFVFLSCAACGIAFGLVYDFFFCLRYPFRARWVRYFTDFSFCLCFTAGYLFLSVLFEFPAFRFYMFVALVAGFFLYLKSVHKIVAFLVEKLYNSIVRKTKDGNLCRKRKDRECRKRGQKGLR